MTNLSQSQQEFLKELATEMSTQNNRMAQLPIFYIATPKWKNITKNWQFRFTAKWAEKHLVSNGYSYQDNAVVYWDYLWRNPEMENLIDIIFTLAWVEKPRHYQ